MRPKTASLCVPKNVTQLTGAKFHPTTSENFRPNVAAGCKGSTASQILRGVCEKQIGMNSYSVCGIVRKLTYPCAPGRGHANFPSAFRRAAWPLRAGEHSTPRFSAEASVQPVRSRGAWPGKTICELLTIWFHLRPAGSPKSQPTGAKGRPRDLSNNITRL